MKKKLISAAALSMATTAFAGPLTASTPLIETVYAVFLQLTWYGRTMNHNETLVRAGASPRTRGGPAACRAGGSIDSAVSAVNSEVTSGREISP